MQRRQFLFTSPAVLAAGCTPATRPAAGSGRTFLVAHGAWSAGWSWKRMHPLLGAAGHRLIVPTCTGLGEREHLATPQVNLETHIQDLLGVIKYEALEDIVLVAHSYGGMVATGVADRVPERIRQLIYVDAFVPRDGEALVDIVPADARERILGIAHDGGWLVPPQGIPDDTSPEDVRWIEQLRIAQPLHCFDTPVRLTNGETQLPRAYIYALRHSPADTFGPFAARARREDWDYREIDASHSPHVTAPERLAELLMQLAD
jgi:pimeloyl-ACP methyl ester carboxylesterase